MEFVSARIRARFVYRNHQVQESLPTAGVVLVLVRLPEEILLFPWYRLGVKLTIIYFEQGSCHID